MANECYFKLVNNNIYIAATNNSEKYNIYIPFEEYLSSPNWGNLTKREEERFYNARNIFEQYLLRNSKCRNRQDYNPPKLTDEDLKFRISLKDSLVKILSITNTLKTRVGNLERLNNLPTYPEYEKTDVVKYAYNPNGNQNKILTIDIN